MKFDSLHLPDTQRFACSEAVLRRIDWPPSVEWVSMGQIRTFGFDRRASKPPALAGPIVASAAVNRDGSSHLCLYPVRCDTYPESAAKEFAAAVLPRIVAWFDKQKARSATAVRGVEELVIEWANGHHREHTLRLL